MDIRNDVPLKNHSTMRLGGPAAHLVTVTTPDQVKEAVAWAEDKGLPVMMIGEGSNIVWRDEGFPGLIIVCAIKGFDTKEDGEDVLVTIGAGEHWDDAVARTVDMDLSGIEGLSLVPGTAGATPVQNVGAYGQEVAQTLVSLDAYDNQTKQMTTLQNGDCNFGYRDSRFKGADRGRFFITSITLRLKHANPQPPYYEALQKYFAEHDIQEVTPRVMREAVIAIRSSKLPDPAKVANNGSFFANPIITTEEFARLQAEHGDVPHWPMGDKVKIPAAWLVERAGFKNARDEATGMATWPAHALVLVNEHATSTDQLLQFKQKIVDEVKNTFGITLEQEPELLP